jgi:hypothetical protein
MKVSDGLFHIAGFFDRYVETGGVVSALECKLLAMQLNALAEAAHSQEAAARAISDEFDAFVATYGGPVDRPIERRLSVIPGGRA